MKKNVIFIFFVLLSNFGFGQNLEWAKNVANSNGNYLHSKMTTDNFGNIFIVGQFYGTIDFDPGLGIANLTANANDIFVMKLDPIGNYVWAKSIGSSGQDNSTCIAIDQAGNVIISGTFQGTVDFDPGISNHFITASGSKNGFFLKLSSSGNFIWAKKIDVVSYVPTEIKIDTVGNVYVTGSFESTMDFDLSNNVFNISSYGLSDIFVWKLDTNFKMIWAKRMGGIHFELASSLCVDVNGAVYTTGHFAGTVDFNPGVANYNLTASGTLYSRDLFVSKLDANGNFLWAQSTGGSDYNDNGYSINADLQGDIYVTGSFSGINVDFNFGANNYLMSSIGERDVFILKLKGNSDFIWARQLGSTGIDEGTQVQLDMYNNVLVAGMFQNTIDFDPGIGVRNYTAGGASDGFLYKLDKNGNFVDVKTIQGNGTCVLYSLKIDDFDNIVINSSATGLNDFDPNIGAVVFNSGMCVAKYCNAPNYANLTGINSTVSNTVVTYSIAPSLGATGYIWQVPPGSTILSGQNTTSINVLFGNQSGTVSVTPTNSCGSGTSSVLEIQICNDDLVFTASDTSICIGDCVTLTAASSNSYLWSTGLGIAGGTSSITVCPTTTTQYSVTSTNGNCVSTKKIKIVVGICKQSEEVTNSIIKLYPNPAKTTISIDGIEQGNAIEIYDMPGKLLFTKDAENTNETIDVSQFADGIYLAKIVTVNQEIQIIKFIIKK